MKIDVVNLKNEKVGTAELPERVFDAPWNAALVHQALTTQLANSRQPLAHTKGRGEVRGGGKKPWRQKGTGRARHGSIRSPIWSGGGVTHGPTNARIFTKKLNKKMLQAAFASALSQKVRDKRFTVVDSMEAIEPKTARMAAVVRTLSGTERISALVIPAATNTSVFRATRNLPYVKSISPLNLNMQDVLSFRRVIIDRTALDAVVSRYAPSSSEK